MSDKLDLFLIRHGSTKFNEKRRILGSTDIELSKYGIEESKKLAILLRNRGVKPDLIYCSQYKRSKQTAEIISKILNVKNVIVTGLLNELDYGKYEGQDLSLFKKIKFGYNEKLMLEGGGETISNLIKRATKFLYLVSKNGDTKVMAVSHACFASVMTQLLKGLPVTYETLHILHTGDYDYFKLSRKNILKPLEVRTNVVAGTGKE